MLDTNIALLESMPVWTKDGGEKPDRQILITERNNSRTDTIKRLVERGEKGPKVVSEVEFSLALCKSLSESFLSPKSNVNLDVLENKLRPDLIGQIVDRATKMDGTTFVNEMAKPVRNPTKESMDFTISDLSKLSFSECVQSLRILEDVRKTGSSGTNLNEMNNTAYGKGFEAVLKKWQECKSLLS